MSQEGKSIIYQKSQTRLKLNQKGYCQNVIYFMSQEEKFTNYHGYHTAKTIKSKILLSESSLFHESRRLIH